MKQKEEQPTLGEQINEKLGEIADLLRKNHMRLLLNRDNEDCTAVIVPDNCYTTQTDDDSEPDNVFDTSKCEYISFPADAYCGDFEYIVKEN